MKILDSLLLVSSLLASATVASAQCDEFQLPEIPQGGYGFGSAVDIGADLLVFGAPGHALASEKGALAWRRVPGGWVGQFAVVAFEDGDEFGAAVDVGDSGRIAIGAPAASNSSGGTGRVAVLSWNGTNATYDAVISPPTNLGYPIEDFGRSVSVSDDGQWILAGAPGTFGDAGCIFVYRLVGGVWTFQQDVFLGTAPDEFGSAVAISGTKVIAGARKFDGAPGVDSGAVFFYDLDVGSGTLTQTGTADGPNAGSEFGAAVAIDGTFSAAGGPLDDSFGVDGGAVFFYVNGAQVTGFGQFAGDQLGASIDIDGDAVLVGRPGTGLVDRYQLNGAGTSVGFVETFGAATPQAGDRFGADVAISGDECAIGAPSFDDPDFFVDSGRVLTYEAIFDTTTFIDLGEGLTGSFGVPSASVSGEICPGLTHTINLSGARPASACALFVGFDRIDASFKGGTLVPANDILVVLSTGAGSLALPAPWPVGIDAIPLFMQWWVQDPAGPVGFSASNAIQTQPPGS